MSAIDDRQPDRTLGTEALLPLVYEELRRIARRERLRVSGGDTLMTTALVHEAYLRLRDRDGIGSRAHFLSVSALAMRGILVDRVRTQLALKRGAGADHVPIDELDELVVEDEQQVLAVDEALKALAQLNPRLVQVVECRFFAGYSEPETAEALGLSERSVQRDWALARAWLKTYLSA